MKFFLSILFLVFLAQISIAQLPPYRRNHFTTNEIPDRFAGQYLSITNDDPAEVAGTIRGPSGVATHLFRVQNDTNKEIAINASGALIGDGFGLTNLTGGSVSYTAVGNGALRLAQQIQVVAVGVNAGVNSGNPSQSVFVGHGAANNSTNLSQSVSLGYLASDTVTNSSRTVMIGWNAGRLGGTASKSVFVGYGAGQANPSVRVGSSNSIFLGYFAGNTVTNPLVLIIDSREGKGVPGTAFIEGDMLNNLLNLRSSVTASNYALFVPQWIGIPCMFGWSVTGPSAPSLTAVTNNSAIQELAFDNGDMLYATAHIPHTIAITNAAFPNQYITPIIHFSTVGTLDATHSNVTWRVEWEVSDVNSAWNRRGTNAATMGVTNNFTHYELTLGHITNNPPVLGTAVWRCRLMRPASALRDYSNTHDVLLDGFDLHVPVGNSIAIGNPND